MLTGQVACQFVARIDQENAVDLLNFTEFQQKSSKTDDSINVPSDKDLCIPIVIK